MEATRLISGFDFVSFKGWLLKKSNFAKIQMQLKSKDEFLWYKGHVPLHNLCFMRPNMKPLKMSDLQGWTLQKSMEQAWAELEWNLRTCNGNNRESLPGRAAAMRKDVLFGQPVLWIPWSVNTYLSQRVLSCEALFCDWVEYFLVDDIFYKTPSSWVKWIIQHQFSLVSAPHREKLENKMPEYSNAETKKQKWKIKIIVFDVTSSVSKQCDCCFLLMIKFGRLTMCLVVNFL